MPEKDAKGGEGVSELDTSGDTVPKLDPLLLPLELTVALPPPPPSTPGVNEGEDDTAGVKEGRGVGVVPLLIEGVASEVREREGEGVEVPQAVPRAAVGVEEEEPLPIPAAAATPDEMVLAGDLEGKLVAEMQRVGVMVGDMDTLLVLEASPLPLAVPLPCPLPLPTKLRLALEDTVERAVEEKDPLGDPVPSPEALFKGVGVPLEENKVEGVRLGVEVRVRKGVAETKGVKVGTVLTL